MAAIRAQVILKTSDGVPENYCTNSLCFDGTDPASDVVALEAALTTFYSTFVPFFPTGLLQNGHEIKWTDLPGTPPNYPFRIGTMNLSAAPSGNPLPSEVSVCLSFQGSKAAGFPQNRRRGRIYVGPLEVSALSTTGRPAAGVLSAWAAAATTFKAAVLAIASDTQWSVWSVTDQAAVEITDGWVDDAFDTQRRRGVDRTTRTLWS